MSLSTSEYRSLIQKSLGAIQSAFGTDVPDIAIILGSGLGKFSEELKETKTLSYEKIPGFPKPTVQGHLGEAVLGKIGKRNVLVFRGRFHFYEGHSLQINTLPVRVAGAWGIKSLVVTNASGVIRKDLQPGLLLMSDHINLIGQNPLFGPNLDEFGSRFFDMTVAYDKEYRAHAKDISRKLQIPLPEGVYAAVAGPSYETSAEIKMLAAIGADAVGMSTAPEVIVARHHGIRVMGISCMANYAAGVKGLASKPITHDEVIQATQELEQDFVKLLRTWIETYE